MNPFTIFILLPSFANGGAERVTLSLIENLDKNIFDYFLVMQNIDGPLECSISKSKIINLHAAKFRYSLFGLVKKINEKKPIVILSTFPHMTIFLLILKKLFFPKTLLIAREPNMPSISLLHIPNSLIYRNLYKICMPAIDGVIASSTAMKKELIVKGVDEKKISVISNPINFKRIRYFKNIQRHKGKGLRIIFVGRLVYQKGLDRILPFLKDIQNIHLTIIGEGKEKNNLMKIIEERQIFDKVNFLGEVNFPYTYIAGADYLILPSRWEGLPNVVLESLTLGTPVIAMEEISGLKDLNINILNKSLMMCKNIEEMLNFLSILPVRKDFKNPKLRASLLKIYNTQISYASKVSNFIKEIIYANKKH